MENAKKLFLPPDGLELVLASGSPRRSDLLKQIGLENFLSDAADIDETVKEARSPKKYAARVALEKAETVRHRHPRCIVLAADTVVTCGTRILDKPTSKIKQRNVCEDFQAVATRCWGRLSLLEQIINM